MLANVTRLGSGRGLAVHLLNYAAQPAAGLRVRIHLDREFAALAGAAPRLFTPDAAGKRDMPTRRTDSGVEFTLDRLDVYSVVIFER